MRSLGDLFGSDDAALAQAVRELWPRAWRVAVAITHNGATAEDVVQDAFEKAFSGSARFRAMPEFSAWLLRVVANRAIDVVRREQRRPEKEAAGRDPQVGEDPAPLLDGDRTLLTRCAELPTDLKTVIGLHYWADLSLLEISQTLEVPIGTVKSRLARGLSELRSRVGVESRG